MDDARNTRLERMLKQLAQAVEAAVVESDEFHRCLAELNGDGWRAEIILGASVLGRGDDNGDPTNARVRIHVGALGSEAEYRLNPRDARWLAAIGISPTRHRSRPQRLLPPVSPPHSRARDDR